MGACPLSVKSTGDIAFKSNLRNAKIVAEAIREKRSVVSG